MMQLLLGASLLLGAAASTPSAPELHGQIEWFQGKFDAALAEAAKSKKILFLDFWTTTCPYCKRLDQVTFSDAAVVAEARSFVCLPVEADSAEGRPIAERYRIAGWPALVFVEADGSLRDRFAGFRGPEQLLVEFRRVHSGLGTFGEVERKAAANPKDVVARLNLVLRLRQLHDERWSIEMNAAREAIAREEGFDPKSPDERFAVARLLRLCSDQKAYDEQIAAIRKIDPEGRSVPLRRLALGDLLRTLGTHLPGDVPLDPGPVGAFLADERHPEVRFEGWASLHELATRRAVSIDQRKRAREFARQAWKDCPADRVADFGREVAVEYLAYEMELDSADRAFAVELAAKASEAAPRSVEALETLADCLDVAVRRPEAIAVLQRALAIDPERASVRTRLEKMKR